MTSTYVLRKKHPGRDNVKSNLHAFVDRLPDTKSWKVEIKEARPERSLDQNAAMYGVAYDVIMAATGLQGDAEKKQLHRDFCGEFFGWVDAGLSRRRPRRTTTTNECGERDVIDTVTMSQFYDFIQRKAAEFGIDVPDPDPFWRERAKAA
ncbi:hypothetical protein [Dyella mobilis]|uniref:NinB protein n=1 Tax=Dyella mobilis TaxID=1849582 RepID=A0ABS2KKD3_9GAMM|nr:hypothetical protein [Dyella mobilis]MBM7131596.1 hypothetical protein [Dyella mobilis]GLQ96429.1 hypothetical protein GCM10007863_08470 [Dyella mobilis]